MAESKYEVNIQTTPISNCLCPDAGLHLGDAASQVASTAQYHCNNKAAQKLMLLIS